MSNLTHFLPSVEEGGAASTLGEGRGLRRERSPQVHPGKGMWPSTSLNAQLCTVPHRLGQDSGWRGSEQAERYRQVGSSWWPQIRLQLQLWPCLTEASTSQGRPQRAEAEAILRPSVLSKWGQRRPSSEDGIWIFNSRHGKGTVPGEQPLAGTPLAAAPARRPFLARRTAARARRAMAREAVRGVWPTVWALLTFYYMMTSSLK